MDPENPEEPLNAIFQDDSSSSSSSSTLLNSPLVTVPSVKALYLRVRTRAHTDLGFLPIKEHFPGMEILEIDNPSNKCSLCNYFAPNFIDEGKLNLRCSCLFALAKPFSGLRTFIPQKHQPDLVLVKYV